MCAHVLVCARAPESIAAPSLGRRAAWARSRPRLRRPKGRSGWARPCGPSRPDRQGSDKARLPSWADQLCRPSPGQREVAGLPPPGSPPAPVRRRRRRRRIAERRLAIPHLYSLSNMAPRHPPHRSSTAKRDHRCANGLPPASSSCAVSS